MRPLKQYKLLLIIALLATQHTKGQKLLTGTVKDAQSEERIPFASISFKNSTIGKLSDSSGKFEFTLTQWPSDTLQITCVGYQPFYFTINTSLDSIDTDMLMERGTFNEGVRVKVKVN